jgi:hypothetical protein
MDWDFYSTIRPGPARPGPARLGPGPLRPDLTCNGKETHGLFAHTHVFFTPPRTARPSPARLVCAHARVLHTTPYGSARPGPARPGTARPRPAQARSHNGKATSRLGRSHTPCFTLPPQRTCRTNTASPQVGPDPLRLPGPTASTRPGPARAIFVDSDNSLLSWVTPIRFAPIDLVSGARGTPTNGWPI